MSRQTEVAYCAGLFDGEGCIMIRRWVDKRPSKVRRPVRYELHAEISQVRVEPIECIFSVFGGRMWFQARRDKNSKYTGRWWWGIDSNHASQVLQAMKPFLRLKQAEADVAIAFQRLKLDATAGRSFKLGLTQDEVDLREAAYLQLRALKKKHYDPALQADYAARPKVARPVTA